ncbi:hypothetical protein FRC04_007649 [Tulasnella sp. 424]|nr:hypothetical protein FRC04_007649 [Tulasnella sp. 424]KAG8979081.1 hypothetical protein FRC05_009291 [Tulasnella sp. 425]
MSSINAGRNTSSNDPAVVTNEALRTNLLTRVSYLISFIGFTSADAEALQAVAPHIRPYLPTVAEAMYNKMWSYDVTRQSLTKPNNPHVPKNADLAQARERMRYMTSFQGHWLLKIFIADWEDLSTFAYFDRVGVSHIGESAFRHRGERGTYQVDYVHIAILLGHINDLLVQGILQLEQITLEEKSRAISALTKAMWIQNDLISRHYVMPVETINTPVPERAARGTPVDINAEAEKCPFSSMYSSSSTVVPNPHQSSSTPSTNPPGYNPRYADDDYVEEPWPDESDSEDEPNPWSNDNAHRSGSVSPRSESDYGDATSTTVGRTVGTRHRQQQDASATEESETTGESSSVESISTSEGVVKSRAAVDPKVLDAVTGKLRTVDLHS